MPPTPHDHVNALLAQLLSQMQAILGHKLAGLYLYGSLVTGAFDDYSDVDLLAAISSDLDTPEYEALDRMQRGIVSNDGQWDNRIEIAYVSLQALKTFRTHTSQIAVVSPGEPFHFKEAGIDWLMNWYVVRKQGIALYGPPPTAIIEPISDDEYVQAVKVHTAAWPGRLEGSPELPFQSYTILTVCRGAYTIRYGKQVSKAQAAAWAAREYPAWAATIENAVAWRRGAWDEGTDPVAVLPETRRFVQSVVDQLLRGC